MQMIALMTLQTGLAQDSTVPYGASFEWPDEEAPSLMARGFACVGTVQTTVMETDHLHAIVDAMTDLSPDAFGKDGKPAVKILEEILGHPVSAAQRDQAWAQYQALSDDHT